jgi:transglutaminase-like putative cysteine protease
VAADPRVELAVRLAAFFALAGFATLHWAALLEPAPGIRLLAVALIATSTAALLALSARLPRAAGAPARALLLVVCVALGVVAVGIRAKLLWPAHWHTLSDRVGGGASVVGSITQWPYSGPNAWLRLTTMSAAPLVVAVSAGLAFWPGPSQRAWAARRFAALALLIVLYGVAAAARPFPQQSLRGVALLAAIAAWLWLPRLRRRDALAAAVAIAVGGLIALGLTAKIASGEPWVDYRTWSWTLHREQTVAFDWRQHYGPIHWPRRGTTLLLIKSKHAHYWRAETLDRFDGFGWTTARSGQEGLGPQDIPQPGRQDWNASVRVTFRGLRSQLAIVPGTPYDIVGAPHRTILLSNGAYVLEGQLKSGDSYTVKSYVPDPKPRDMRHAPAPEPSLIPFTTIGIPDRSGFTSTDLEVPLRGASSAAATAEAARSLSRSRYGRIYRLAHTVTAGAATTYQMVLDVGSYLQRNYSYSEHPPPRQFPIDAFLFRDKIGYCQQFSGAAALMLRMLGIPARVVSGFAPGTRDAQTHEFVVRDLDAHAWIEVWFQGIGWVTFDPTPAVAPPAAQSIALAPRAEDRRKPNAARSHPDPGLATAGGAGGAGAGASGQGPGTAWGAAALGVGAIVILATALAAVMRSRRVARRPRPAPCGDPEVDHLVLILTRLGLDVGPDATLLSLEDRLRRLAGPDAGAYVRRLRERRFGGALPRPVARGERRRLRHLLAEAVDAGTLTRLHLALPERPVGGVRGLKLVR